MKGRKITRLGTRATSEEDDREEHEDVRGT